jgi:cbb3-type cytochrome oxidase maturation protein
MEILPFLLAISVVFFFGAILFFFWNVNNGQYDDLDSPAHKILYDDDEDLIPRTKNKTQDIKTDQRKQD